MSLQEARKVSSRGPEWDRMSKQVRRQYGAYKDADGKWHEVCRNWFEARRLGLPDDVLPKGCVRTNGEDEVWACHGQGWSTHPALRLVPENLLGLCRWCDPDRNPRVRPLWWGSPNHPVKAGWERRGFTLAKRHKLLNLVLGMPVWTLLVIANAQLRYFAFLRPYSLGLPVSGRDFLTAAGILVGLYVGCVGGVDYSLRHRFLSRGARGILHGVVRLVRRTRHAKEPQHHG